MKINTDTVTKLKEAFAMGCNVTEACIFADVSRKTYYQWIKENPDMGDDFETLRDKPGLKARMNIVREIAKGDIDTSKWYAERKNKAEFSQRQELEHSGDMKINIVSYESDNNDTPPVQT